MLRVAEPIEAANAWPVLPCVPLFGIGVHAMTMQEAVATIGEWLDQPWGRCRYVVTPNTDHVVLLQQHAGLRQAYAGADLVLADGWPLVFASRWLGKPLPARVAGSDLVPALLAARPGMRVFLLGAAPGVAATAAHRIRATWPGVDVTGTWSPPPGFEQDKLESQRILRRIAEALPDLLVVGLGAPKQELWVHQCSSQLRAKVAVCAGATIDFLAGHRRRAPQWMRRIGLEWLHRMMCEPRRLSGRYLRDAIQFPGIVLRERLAGSG